MAVLILFGIYMRLRRTIGRQKVKMGRLVFRDCLSVVFGVLVPASAVASPEALVGGLAGAALGLYGLRLTSPTITILGEVK